MNLRQIANNYTQSINPNIQGVLVSNQGYNVDDAGKRTANTEEFAVTIQVQGTSEDMLKQVEMLNIQGVFRCVYINGNWSGVIRTNQKGGDQLRFIDYVSGQNKTWNIVQVMEAWPDWTKVLVCLQS